MTGDDLVRFTDFPKPYDHITSTIDELSKVQESIQGCTSLMPAVRYPPLAVFLIAPEHSGSEGMSTRYCDWEEGGLGC